MQLRPAGLLVKKKWFNYHIIKFPVWPTTANNKERKMLRYRTM